MADSFLVVVMEDIFWSMAGFGRHACCERLYRTAAMDACEAGVYRTGTIRIQYFMTRAEYLRRAICPTHLLADFMSLCLSCSSLHFREDTTTSCLYDQNVGTP